jgi:molybdopterin/thiamine biosynthesis adenylyltransferase
MRYGITFLQEDYEALTRALLGDESAENAAYLFGRVSTGPEVTRILVREVRPVPPDEVNSRSSQHISIPSRSYVRALQYAERTKQCFLFAHSHPHARNAVAFSEQDDREESDLFGTAYNRDAPSLGQNLHASLVLGGPSDIVGRVWLPNGGREEVEKISVIGQGFQYLFPPGEPSTAIAPFFDRQVRVFGPDTQRLLGRLHIGLVGAGGTGSAALQELVRLGVGRITVVDPDIFEASNVNRVYGSRIADEGLQKIEIAQRAVDDIGLGTKISVIRDTIAFCETARVLLDCDVIFGCTDDHLGRLILCRLSLTQYLPVFDVAVGIDSENGALKGVEGRVTTLLPGEACLVCRNRISVEHATAEGMRLVDPDRLEHLQREGYAPELEGNAPAVIPYTTGVSSLAMSEFLHRLTGFMGPDRHSTELVMLFHASEIGRNRRKGQPSCFCQQEKSRGVGDTRAFLGMSWPDKSARQNDA